MNSALLFPKFFRVTEVNVNSFSNDKKKNQLGMSFGKANNILKKNLLFLLVQKLELDVCYRCEKKIETVEDFSVEHKINWLNSENPIELFFDLNNIAFSHFNCNSNARNKNSPHLNGSGEEHYMSKLKTKEILEIREKIEKGMCQAEIAREYNTTRSTINDIKFFRTRKYEN